MARGIGRPRSGVLRTALVAVSASALLAGAGAAVPAAAAAPRAAEAAPAAAAAAAQPLPPELEQIRAAEATELYGDPAVRPMDERKTSLITLGDSEISGEGVGNYESDTNGPDNWCHRSRDAAVHRTGIPADETYNVACSGASTVNIRIGGEKQYADELVQSDSLAIKARNTRLKTILLVAGANDDLQFGPVITDCVIQWFLPWQGPCAPEYEPTLQDRVDGLAPKVEATIGDLRTVMRDAGYADGSYELVVMGYPGPVGPDFRDASEFSGKLIDGCTLADEDTAMARNKAVPVFETGIRRAARNAGATFLDASRLFHGHEVCMDDDWVRGLWVDPINPFPPNENSVRQSFHPHYDGHGAFASCLTQLHGTGLDEASCAAPGGSGEPELYPWAWDDVFGPLRSASGPCLALADNGTRNGTPVRGESCDGERRQGWWHDPGSSLLHTELTHDRCLDVPEGTYQAGAELVLWDCSGAENQRFVRDSGSGALKPEAAPDLCVTLPGAGQPVTLQPCDGSDRQRFA